MDDNQQIRWISAAQAGNIESFGRLCECYYNSITAVAYSVLGDHHLAEDAAQETFARALKSLGQLKSSNKFAPWLAQICRNVAMDLARTKSRYVPAQYPEQLEAKSNPQPDNTFVHQALKSLSGTDRELIVMRYYNALSQKEMSALLGLSASAVNNRLLRAKEKIATYLKNHGFGEVQL
jgi:RNA polymerase sigma-70 factor (ECF subfamily)